MTVKEAASQAGVGEARIKQLCEAKRFDAALRDRPVQDRGFIRLQRCWVIDAESFTRFLEKDRPTGLHLDRQDA